MKENIGEIIKKYRKLNKLTQKDLAKLLNISYRTLQNYENSETLPSMHMLISICNLLKIDKSELFNTNNYNHVDEYCVRSSHEMISEEYCNYDTTPLENSFKKYINLLLKDDPKTAIIPSVLTESDYFLLMKHCNNSFLNLLQLYIDSKPTILNLKELNERKDDNY